MSAELRHLELENENGGAYRLTLHVPSGVPPAQGWPVLYMTDGNAVFATARDALRVQASYPTGSGVGPGVIVAIGYPTDEPYDPYRRSWDLTPPPGRSYPPFREGGPPALTGGAAAFLAFLEERVKPAVAAEAPIDPTRQSLFGHSFGGLFALFTLFTRPGSFETIVAASPSLTWEDGVIRALQDQHLATCAEGPPARVLLSAGEYEGDRLPPFLRQQPDAAKRLDHLRAIRTAATAAELAHDLNERSRGRVRASFELFSGENHMSVLPTAINRAVQAAFSINPNVQFERD